MKRDLSRLQKTVSSSSAGEIEIIPAEKVKSSGKQKNAKTKDAIALDTIKELENEKLESSVNNEVDDLLNLYHIYHWRNNTGSYKKKGRYISYGKRGSWVWLGFCDFGRFLAIEDKRPVKGKLSKLQRDFLDDINQRGGVGIVVTSAADCLAQLKEAGVIK